MKYLPLLLLAVLAGACSKDDESTPAETPTTPTSPTPGTSSSGLTIAFDSGTVDAETYPVATVLPVRVHVTQSGKGVANVPVTWRITTGRGKLSDTTTTTNASGATFVNWTLADTVGANVASASITGASVTLTALTKAGPVASIVRVTPDSSRVVAGAALPILARAVDQFGNAASGAVVNWTTTGGVLSAASVTTGSSGNAGTNLATDATPKTYTVTATLPGKSSVTFKVVGF